MYRRVSGRTNFHRPKTCHYCMLIVSVRGDTVVGISITIFLVFFSAGALLVALITYCCCVREIGESSSGQAYLSPSESPVETLEMKENPSYSDVGQ